MKEILRVSILLLAILVLTGCGSKKVAVQPELNTNIQTIALIKVSEPDAYIAQDFGNPGVMFGGVGGAIAGSSSVNAGKNVNQIVAEQNYAAGIHFTDLLKNKLTASGYHVKLIAITRKNNQELLENYDSIDPGGADAILDVVIESIGYATEHPMFSPHWRPAAQVKVALIDSRSGNQVYAEKFMYGYHNPFLSGTDIEAPKAYQFKNKDELFSDSDKLVAGIQRSVEDVVNQVQNNLKK